MLLNVFPALATARQSQYETQLTPEIQTSPLGSDAKLGWILVHKHWISSSELELMLDQQAQSGHQSGQKLGELLLKNSLISADQLTEALREQYWRRHGYWVIQD